ncbi:MAG: hypothetical protein JO103_12220, partial [Candidatus Eremiobacteraeota bacterium]|nr:hypothetical protein [Candidatus Eremiobacteraeota bacterium]
NLVITGGFSQSATVPLTITVSPVVPNPTSLSFLATGTTYNQTVTVSQGGFSGTYTAQIVDTGGTNGTIATASVSGTTITVTPLAAGTANLVITGGSGRTATVPIGITVSPITIH